MNAKHPSSTEKNKVFVLNNSHLESEQVKQNDLK